MSGEGLARRTRIDVLGAPIDAVDLCVAVDRVLAWGAKRHSATVCACNVHSVVESRGNPALAEAIATADLAVPDGAPVAWFMRRRGRVGQRRVTGPDLMWACCGAAAAQGQGIFLYGATPSTLALLSQRLLASFPGLVIAGTHAPPFRRATAEEDAEIVARINSSGAGTVWVALGCPKQEIWIAAHRGRVHAVMVGVGAAFDFHAGTTARAPTWMRGLGLEWLHRLASEPRRLWRRYLVTNTVFLYAALHQLARR